MEGWHEEAGELMRTKKFNTISRREIKTVNHGANMAESVSISGQMNALNLQFADLGNSSRAPISPENSQSLAFYTPLSLNTRKTLGKACSDIKIEEITLRHKI